jgi:hypothetical protein
MIRPWIKKDIASLPDKYGVTVHFIDGTKETFECASHKFVEKHGLELALFEDLFEFIVLNNVKRISFDKEFSKIVAAKTAGDK